jgi:hypothetical protein
MNINNEQFSKIQNTIKRILSRGARLMRIQGRCIPHFPMLKILFNPTMFDSLSW